MSEARARRQVYERSGGMCEVCGCAPGQSWHHRQPRGQGGRWSAANGLHTCGDGTTGCHGWIERNRRKAYAAGWLVHSWDDPHTTPVRLRMHGWSVLDDAGHIHREETHHVGTA